MPTSAPRADISWFIFKFTKFSELIFGVISSLIPTLRNSTVVEVTGSTVLVVRVVEAMGISSVIDMLAGLLSDDLNINKEKIKKEWPNYRCNPTVMPFANVFGHDTMKNFTYCVQNLQSTFKF